MSNQYLEDIKKTSSIKEIEDLRISLLGKKGVISLEFGKMKTIPNDEKKEFAKNLNILKTTTTKAINEQKEILLQKENLQKMKEKSMDVTMFNSQLNSGALHPISTVMDEIIDFFKNLNFSVEDGPLVEDDFHNFEALNLPKFHPARDMQDTFYFNDGNLLRTHTSPVQIRTMLELKKQDTFKPIRMIAPGSVFRRDLDLTHTPMFHQVEGLVVEQGNKVSFANLKYILETFLQHMFGDVKVRFRPSFFPFTEPSAEVDISCIFCKAEGCRVCSQTGWLEVLGCGIVDENVFKAVGYENVSGYAFGLGVERFAMLLHKIPDLRSLFAGDTRLLKQFR